MDKESYDALIEQQTREINNLKAIRDNERKRIIKIIKSHPVEKFIGFKCTSCDNFPYFINNWVDDLIAKITGSGKELR